MGDVVKMPTIGSRIKEQRLGWGMSLDALARKVGMSKASIWSIEKGRSDPWISTVIKLATALRVSVSWLATGDADNFQQGFNAGLRHVQDNIDKSLSR